MPRDAAQQIGKVGDYIHDTQRRYRQRLALDLLDAGLRGVSVARQTAPVDTGLLKRSISLVEKPSPTHLQATFATPVRYGAYQEFGTRGRDGRPRIRARHYIFNGVVAAGETLQKRGWQGGGTRLGGL